MRTRLATFVHVSDLHIGEPDALDDAILDAHSEAWLARQPWFDGYLGHTGAALRHLDSFFEFMRQSESADILVTGDLSTVGAHAELSLARAYLTRVHWLGGGKRLGLGVSDALDRAVLGNHDHWPGRRARHSLDPVMLGRRAPHGSVAPAVMPSVAYRLLAPGVELALIRINSDADVRPLSIKRLFGRAAFHSQLADSAAVPRPPAQGVRQIRAMLLHHSPNCTTFKLGMSNGMRKDLREFLVKTDTRVLLTGHMHLAGSRPAFTPPCSVLEAHCGSTTQRDSVPPGWKPRRPPPEKNTLLVHRIFDDDGHRLSWEVERYQRTVKGFVRSGQQRPVGGWTAHAHPIHP